MHILLDVLWLGYSNNLHVDGHASMLQLKLVQSLTKVEVVFDSSEHIFESLACWDLLGLVTTAVFELRGLSTEASLSGLLTKALLGSLLGWLDSLTSNVDTVHL